MEETNKFLIIGYSGHAFVVIDSAIESSYEVLGYCDLIKKKNNPFNLEYLGKETKELLNQHAWFIGIGNNEIRSNIISNKNSDNLISIVHPSAIIARDVVVGKGTFVGPGAIINTLSTIGIGCIINSGSIVEHENRIHDYVHIAPGAVLAGSVTVGKRTFIGANSVIKQGVNVGSDVVVGAGAVVLNDVPDACIIVGNPGRIIN